MQKRVVISVISWLTSSYAIYLCATQIHLYTAIWLSGSKTITPVPSLLLLGYPWLALLVMNLGWIKNKKVHWLWWATGSLTGCMGLFLSFGLGFVFAPLAIILAFYLVYFHMVLAPALPTHQAGTAK